MAAVVEAFVTRLTDRFFMLLHDNTIMFSKVRSEIEGLDAAFHNIKHVLSETEMTKIEDRAINIWRLRLKDVMYDIDDILDEYHIWDEKKCLSSEVLFRFPLNIRKFIFYIQIGTKIREINTRLNDISKKRIQFDIKIDCNSTPPPTSRKRSYIAAFDIASSVIEESTDKLVEALTKEDIFAKSIFHGIRNKTVDNIVYAIIGIGGIGKTTLAQNIYNDGRITAGFEMKLWVSVTQHVTDMDVLWYIITTLGINAPTSNDRNVLEAIVKDALAGKMIFIVLDDVWDEQIWYGLFYELLYMCVKGSRVLITTRKEGVARQMKAIHIHRVELMPPEDGWKLLCKEVTLTGENEVEDLKDVGLRIVNKCGGLPLAIKAIGGVLRYKEKRRREWVAVLESASWSISGLPEGVQAALYLSYKDLPSHLKECFLYTCMFPSIPFYSRLYLIQFWIAEGFIKGDNNRTLESVGEDYYAELMQRGLLQSDPLSYDCAACTVHELLQLLAQFLVQGESLILPHARHIIENVSEGSSSSVLMKPRRLCTRVSEGEIVDVLNVVQKNSSLRTLFLRSSKFNNKDVDYVVKNASSLRVLDLRYSTISKLPESFGSMLHIRLLVLTDSTITSLPASIGDLVNLLFLRLQGCKNLHKLPEGLVKLLKLRCLDLFETDIEGFPSGINRLKHLNVLQGYVINQNSSRINTNNNTQSHKPSSFGVWSNLEDLRALTNLRRLTVHKLESSHEYNRNKGSVLKDMTQLEHLELNFTQPQNKGRANLDHTDNRISKIEEILEIMLLPPPNVEMLAINGFFGGKLPTWLMFSCVPQLRWLSISCCNRMERLTPLGMLPNLDHLEIRGALAIKNIGMEFFGEYPSILFPKLTTLIFKDILNWEEWNWDQEASETSVVFPYLKILELHNCISLRTLPNGLFDNNSSLTELLISQCSSLIAITGFTYVQKFILKKNHRIEHLSGFHKLEVMMLEDDQMNSLPAWFSEVARTLKKLVISNCSYDLLESCRKDGSDWPKIQHIPYVYIHVQTQGNYVRKNRSSYNTGIDSTTANRLASESDRFVFLHDRKGDYMRHWGDKDSRWRM